MPENPVNNEDKISIEVLRSGQDNFLIPKSFDVDVGLKMVRYRSFLGQKEINWGRSVAIPRNYIKKAKKMGLNRS